MRLRVDDAGAVTLEDAEDCGAFSIVGIAPGSPSIVASLRTAGVHLTEDHAHGFVEPAAVIERAAGVADAGWRERFDGMVGYAQTKGWTDADGRIRAHTDWDR
ncbi:MAG: hypothetical protein ACK5OX_03510 [Desertimonas sp.]